jgi:hypothetical protein
MQRRLPGLLHPHRPGQLQLPLHRDHQGPEGRPDLQVRAKDDAASARTLAIIGLVVGILGLVAGGVALARGRRPAAPADTTVRS